MLSDKEKHSFYTLNMEQQTKYNTEYYTNGDEPSRMQSPYNTSMDQYRYNTYNGTEYSQQQEESDSPKYQPPDQYESSTNFNDQENMYPLESSNANSLPSYSDSAYVNTHAFTPQSIKTENDTSVILDLDYCKVKSYEPPMDDIQRFPAPTPFVSSPMDGIYSAKNTGELFNMPATQGNYSDQPGRLDSNSQMYQYQNMSSSTQSMSCIPSQFVLMERPENPQSAPPITRYWKSLETLRPKKFNCITCNKWFTCKGHLKRHYYTALHKKNGKNSSSYPEKGSSHETLMSNDSSSSSTISFLEESSSQSDNNVNFWQTSPDSASMISTKTKSLPNGLEDLQEASAVVDLRDTTADGLLTQFTQNHISVNSSLYPQCTMLPGSDANFNNNGSVAAYHSSMYPETVFRTTTNTTYAFDHFEPHNGAIQPQPPMSHPQSFATYTSLPRFQFHHHHHTFSQPTSSIFGTMHYYHPPPLPYESGHFQHQHGQWAAYDHHTAMTMSNSINNHSESSSVENENKPVIKEEPSESVESHEPRRRRGGGGRNQGNRSNQTENNTANINNDTMYKCHDCNRSFSKAGYLTQHNRSSHSGERPYKCIACGKRFKADYLYKEHLDMHKADKPFKCESCPKQFNHKTDLRRHCYVHSGKKPHACEICGKGFIRKDHMLKHCDIHFKKMDPVVT